MHKQRMGLPLQVAAAVLAVIALAPVSARADNLESFDFSGTLTNSYAGSNSVTGSFTLDTTNGTITAFDFATPVATIDAADGWSGEVASYTPAYSPDEDFVQLSFNDGGVEADNMSLLFQTTLGSFSGSNFYTFVVEPFAGSAFASGLVCDDFGLGPYTKCSEDGFGSTFTSGSATPVSPVPEPSPLVLLGSALIVFAAVSLFRRAAPNAAAGRAGALGAILGVVHDGVERLWQTRRYCAQLEGL